MVGYASETSLHCIYHVSTEEGDMPPRTGNFARNDLQCGENDNPRMSRRRLVGFSADHREITRDHIPMSNADRSPKEPDEAGPLCVQSLCQINTIKLPLSLWRNHMSSMPPAFRCDCTSRCRPCPGEDSTRKVNLHRLCPSKEPILAHTRVTRFFGSQDLASKV